MAIGLGSGAGLQNWDLSQKMRFGLHRAGKGTPGHEWVVQIQNSWWKQGCKEAWEPKGHGLADGILKGLV